MESVTWEFERQPPKPGTAGRPSFSTRQSGQRQLAFLLERLLWGEQETRLSDSDHHRSKQLQKQAGSALLSLSYRWNESVHLFLAAISLKTDTGGARRSHRTPCRRDWPLPWLAPAGTGNCQDSPPPRLAATWSWSRWVSALSDLGAACLARGTLV